MRIAAEIFTENETIRDVKNKQAEKCREGEETKSFKKGRETDKGKMIE